MPGAMALPRGTAESGGGNAFGAALAGLVLGALARDPKARRREPTGGLKDPRLAEAGLDRSTVERSGKMFEGRPGGLAKRRGPAWSRALGVEGLAITEADEGIASATLEEISESKRAPFSDEAGIVGAAGAEPEDGVKDFKG